MKLENVDVSRRQFLFRLAGGIGAVIFISSYFQLACLRGTEQAKPNIVMVMCDQLRFDRLGAMGDMTIKTPNIDELGRNAGPVYGDRTLTTGTTETPGDRVH